MKQMGDAPSYGATADAYGYLELEVEISGCRIEPAGWHLPGRRRALSAPFPEPDPLAGIEVKQ